MLFTVLYSVKPLKFPTENIIFAKGIDEKKVIYTFILVENIHVRKLDLTNFFIILMTSKKIIF